MVSALAFASIAVLSSDNASATNPTITKWGILPAYGVAGYATTFHFFLTYTDADNDAPSAGYPRACKATPAEQTYPTFTFAANDTGDTNYVDGKAYYYNWTYFPVVGVTLWRFEVASNSSAEVYKWPVPMNVQVVASGVFNLYPDDNRPGEKTFALNYSSPWGLAPYNVRVLVDGVDHAMIQNDTDDLQYYDGKLFYFSVNLTAGLHNYTFFWTSISGYPEQSSGPHWLLLQEASMNISLGAIFIVGLIGIVILILWVGKR